VEAFVAGRKVNGRKEYLVKWRGYELVGEEAAYTWQAASVLQEDLGRRAYRALVGMLREQEAAGAEGSSGAEDERQASERAMHARE
jgi:hypothetical protein